VLAIAGVATLAVVLFAVPLAVVLQRASRDEELLRLQRDTVAATRVIDLGSAGGDPIELPSDPRQLAVYGANAQRLAGPGPATGDSLVRDAMRRREPTSRVRDGRIVVAVPLVESERVSGAVRAERDAQEATSLAGGHGWLLAGVGAAVVVIAALAAAALGRHLARPLERLAGAAHRLGEGDFSVRAPEAGVREVDEVAAALDSAAARLDELLQRERSFAANASHQLRTPLAALRLEIEALQLHGDSSEELAAALTQVDRLESTIGTLLAVARDAPRSTRPTPLRALLDEAESRWRGPLAGEDRPLHVQVDAGEPVAQAPEAILREIVDVLLDNALRHGSGAVEVRVRTVGGSLALDVADEGRGVDGDPERIFQRRSGTDEAHGIGLALARSLAEAEGGRLTLAQSGGTVFTVLLPAAANDSVAERQRV
jgi:signal transduction histidine kinase